MKTELTNEGMKALEPGEGQLEIFDSSPGAPAGFGVRVGARAKTFFLVHRVNGKKRRVSLGTYPKTTLRQARKQAKTILVNDLDPGGEREREREMKNFAGLAAAFLEARTGELRPNTAREYRRIVNNELVPRFEDLVPSKISRLAAKQFLKDKATNHPTQANRIRAVALSLFSWANDEDITTRNPFAGIKAVTEVKRDRVLKNGEIRAIWRATERLSPVPQAFVRVLFLTGLRRSEVLGAKWSDIDTEGGYWRIPTVATKSQMRLDVPLTPKLREIFEALQAFTGEKTYVFASFNVGDKDVPISGVSQLKKRLDKDSGVSGWRLHDIRRTVITRLGEDGASDEIKRALLGHAQSGALAHYDHSSMAIQKREWLERWQKALEAIVTHESEVVKMA